MASITLSLPLKFRKEDADSCFVKHLRFAHGRGSVEQKLVSEESCLGQSTGQAQSAWAYYVRWNWQLIEQCFGYRKKLLEGLNMKCASQIGEFEAK